MSNSAIDWHATEPIVVARSKDLRPLFDPAMPWHTCLRTAPVLMVPERLLHVMEKEADGRMEIFRQRPDLILGALEYPQIVETEPRYWDKIDHYSQTYVIEPDDDRQLQRYIGVAVNLANPPGEHESDHHYMRTCYVLDNRNLFTPQGALKPRWRWAK